MAEQLQPEVVVLGAGPAGLSVAIHLAMRGRHCHVVESRKREEINTSAPYGAFQRSFVLAVRERGLALLDALGGSVRQSIVDDAVQQPATFVWRTPTDAAASPTKTETTLGDTQFVHAPRDVIISHMLRRIDELNAEHEGEPLVKMSFGVRVLDAISVEPTQPQSGGAVAKLVTDGTPIECGVLIGSDGVNSVVRRLLQHRLGSALHTETFPDPSPYKLPLVPPIPILSNSMHIFTNRAVGNIICLPFKDGHSTLSVLPRPTLPPNCGVEREWFETAVEATPERVTALAKFLQTHFAALTAHVDATDLAQRILPAHGWTAEAVRISAFADGNVVVLGDAIHSTLPVTGQGLSAALLDAHQLFHTDGWDGSVEGAATAFASFSSRAAGDRGALFELSRWVSSNRWSMKYLIFLLHQTPLMRLHRLAPWLVNRPIYAEFNAHDGSYAKGWATFGRQARAFKLGLFGLATSVSTLVIPNVARSLSAASPMGTRTAYLLTLAGTLPAIAFPYHLISGAKHLSLFLSTAAVGSHLDLSRLPPSRMAHIGAMLLYTSSLATYSLCRDSAASFQARRNERDTQLHQAHSVKSRLLVSPMFAGIYLAYAWPGLVALSHDAVSPPPPLATAVTWAGVGLISAGTVLAASADWTKLVHKQRHGGDHVVTSGPWALCRRPNYLGELLVWVGNVAASAPAFTDPAHWMVGFLVVGFKFRIMSAAAAKADTQLKARIGDKAWRNLTTRVPARMMWAGREPAQ